MELTDEEKQNKCFICLDICNMESDCKCNAFIHRECQLKLHKKYGSKKCVYCQQGLDNIKEEKKYLYRCPLENGAKPSQCFDENCNFMHLTTKNRKLHWGRFDATDEYIERMKSAAK